MKTKKNLGGPHPEGCITDASNMRVEKTSWEYGRMEAPFEGGQGPEWAGVPYVDGWMCNSAFKFYN